MISSLPQSLYDEGTINLTGEAGVTVTSPPDLGERWAEVPGYGGDYEVSSLGRVRSHKRRKPYLMALVPNSDGYLTVQLSDGHRVLTRYIVHRLVCAAFNGDPEPGQEVAHLDGTRTNNRADNLIWATRQENSHHKNWHGTRQSGELNGRARCDRAKVDAIREMAAAGLSGRKISRQVGLSKTAVHRIINRETWND